MRHQPPPPSAQTPSSAGSRPHRHKQPHGGIIAPLERRIKLESTAPATRNKRGVVKADAMFFSVYSWEVLKTRVLATLVAVSACGGFDAVSSKVQDFSRKHAESTTPVTRNRVQHGTEDVLPKVVVGHDMM